MSKHMREKMDIETVIRIGEMAGRNKDPYYIAGKVQKNYETVRNYVNAFKRHSVFESVKKVNKDLFRAACREMGLAIPSFADEKVRAPKDLYAPDLISMAEDKKIEQPEPEPEKKAEDQMVRIGWALVDQLREINKTLKGLVK